MDTNTQITTRFRIYIKSEVSDPDTMYFHQEMKENDATQSLKTVHKAFADFIIKGIFELITKIRVPEGEIFLPAVWAMKRK